MAAVKVLDIKEVAHRQGATFFITYLASLLLFLTRSL